LASKERKDLENKDWDILDPVSKEMEKERAAAFLREMAYVKSILA